MTTLSQGQDQVADGPDGESDLYYRPQRKNRRIDEDNPSNTSGQSYEDYTEDFYQASFSNSNEEQPSSFSINSMQTIQLQQQYEPQQPTIQDFRSDDNENGNTNTNTANISDEADADSGNARKRRRGKKERNGHQDVNKASSSCEKQEVIPVSFSCPTSEKWDDNGEMISPLSCYTEFNDMVSLQNHMKQVHPFNDPSPRIFCFFPGCGKQFTKPARLNKHVKQHDAKREREIPSAEISQQQTASKMSAPQSPPPPQQNNNNLPCSSEGELGSVPMPLESVENPGFFNCPFPECKRRSFKALQSVQMHMQSKHNISSTTPAPKLKVKENLESGDKKGKRKKNKVCQPLEDLWKCPFDDCKYETKLVSNKNHHIRLHVGDKCPYPCDVPGCEASYTSFSFLRKHLMIIHDQAPLNKGEEWRKKQELNKLKGDEFQGRNQEGQEMEEEEVAGDGEKMEDDLEGEQQQLGENETKVDRSEGQISHDENFQVNGEETKVVVKEEPRDVPSTSQDLAGEQKERDETTMMPIKVE